MVSQFEPSIELISKLFIPNAVLGYYSSLHNRVSKILRLNMGFVLKLRVLYFIGISIVYF